MRRGLERCPVGTTFQLPEMRKFQQSAGQCLQATEHCALKHGSLQEAMDLFITRSVVRVTWAHAYVQTHHIVYSNCVQFFV